MILSRMFRLFRQPKRAPGDELARAIALLEQGEVEAAAAAIRVLASKPETLPHSLYLDALIAEKRGDPAAALVKTLAAIEAASAEPVYWLKAAQLCFTLGDYVKSSEWYERLLGLAGQPFRDDPFILFAAAGAAERLSRSARAIELLERAMANKPDFEPARRNLSTLLALNGETAAARKQMDAIVRAAPTAAARLRRALMLAPVYQSDAEIVEARLALSRALEELLAEPQLDLGEPNHEVGLTAFLLAYHGRNDVELLTKLAQTVRRGYRRARTACHAGGRGAKIRIGILSSFFHNHSVARTTYGLIRDLPRASFEVQVFAIAPRADEWAATIRGSADHYLALPDDLERIRQVIEAAGLDMLLFADIGMHPTTYFLAFWRLAPIQLTTWGHSDTSGIDTVDYYVSGETVEVPEADAHYSETLIRLPGYFMPRYQRPLLAGPRPPRATLGLPSQAHLYLCPQTLIKLHPDFDSALKAILERDPAAQILLMDTRAQLTQQIRRRFAATLGRLDGRVRFLPPMPNDRFLQVVAAADVILDPFYFGGCNSTCEALSLATPVVAMPGPFLRGNFTLGLYREIGIDSCIAGSAKDFVQIAVHLGTDHEYRAHVSGEIAKCSAQLFDRPDAGEALGAELMRIADTRR